jgi:uncharacterized protein with HEPN domain
VKKRNIALYIKDIIENMDRAEAFTKDFEIDMFSIDEKTQYAVVRCIEIIGEAAKQVPEHIRQKYPEIPWRDMAGMRDKVIHFYFGVNAQKVWLVVKEDIPRLKPRLKAALNELENE